jgi:sulfate adenylyltransferase
VYLVDRLGGAGKSTTADLLAAWLQESGREVTVWDGDVIRLNLCRELGFSREERDVNILRRIGFVASEVVRHGGVVGCATVSPYRSTRNEVRAMFGEDRFVEIFVDTPLEECERRDVVRSRILQASMIRMKRRESPEIRLATTESTPEENARTVLAYLRNEGFLKDS